MGSHTPGWKWLSFFAIQAPLIAAERVSRKQLQRCGIQLPAWLSVPLTLGVLLLIADALFFSVWYGTEFADRVDSAIQNDLHSIKHTLSSWNLRVFD